MKLQWILSVVSATECIREMDCEPADCEWMKMLTEESVDAAPVVRCKDCKYRDGTPGQPNILCAQMHEDDFCSYGERKEEPHDRLQKDL